MIRVPRPRTWIALLAGIAAGLVVWMLPPLQDQAIATSGSVLRGLSLGGRHVATWNLNVAHGTDPIEIDPMIQLWNGASAHAEPIVNIRAQTLAQVRFSPAGERGEARNPHD